MHAYVHTYIHTYVRTYILTYMYVQHFDLVAVSSSSLRLKRHFDMRDFKVSMKPRDLRSIALRKDCTALALRLKQPATWNNIFSYVQHSTQSFQKQPVEECIINYNKRPFM